MNYIYPIRYKDFLPAFAVQDVKALDLQSESCVVNGNTLLLGCPGERERERERERGVVVVLVIIIIQCSLHESDWLFVSFRQP